MSWIHCLNGRSGLMRRSQCSKGFFAKIYVKVIHVWLVANSYLSLLHYSVPQNMTEYCGNVWSLIYIQHGDSLSCTLHAVFVIICYSVCVKEYVLDPKV
jgi:hypothetical protein